VTSEQGLAEKRAGVHGSSGRSFPGKGNVSKAPGWEPVGVFEDQKVTSVAGASEGT
jgi:hypothetical protein